MIELLTLFAGILSVAAPCLLPMLPLILTGSIRGERSKWKPFIIATSLGVSIFVFTLILRVSTALVSIDPSIWQLVSGMILVTLGLITVFPALWSHLLARFSINQSASKTLGSTISRSDKIAPILTGAALGPVFSSCSPMYAWILATVIPTSLARGIFLLVIYCLGVVSALCAIGYGGQKFLSKFNKLTHPTFQKIIGALFILLGVAIILGLDKTLQSTILDLNLSPLKSIENLITPE